MTYLPSMVSVSGIAIQRLSAVTCNKYGFAHFASKSARDRPQNPPIDRASSAKSNDLTQ
jgi:hypothetical protein